MVSICPSTPSLPRTRARCSVGTRSLAPHRIVSIRHVRRPKRGPTSSSLVRCSTRRRSGRLGRLWVSRHSAKLRPRSLCLFSQSVGSTLNVPPACANRAPPELPSCLPSSKPLTHGLPRLHSAPLPHGARATLLCVVEDDPQHHSLTAAERARSVAHLHAVVAALTSDRAFTIRKDHRVTTPGSH